MAATNATHRPIKIGWLTTNSKNCSMICFMLAQLQSAPLPGAQKKGCSIHGWRVGKKKRTRQTSETKIRALPGKSLNCAWSSAPASHNGTTNRLDCQPWQNAGNERTAQDTAEGDQRHFRFAAEPVDRKQRDPEAQDHGAGNLAPCGRCDGVFGHASPFER